MNVERSLNVIKKSEMEAKNFRSMYENRNTEEGLRLK